jgi:uncharacterized protein YdaU (DUF1376 family)
MVAKADLWMPLYIGEYVADTMRFTTEQHGAYCLLMMDYWRSGPPPDDDEVLASITKVPIARWKKVMRPVIAEKFTIKAGVWKHKRIESERSKADDITESLSERGKMGAEARWNKDPSANGQNHATANARKDGRSNATAMPEPMLGDAPLQSQSQVPPQSQSQPPPPNQSGAPAPIGGTSLTAAGAMATELRRLEVEVTSMHPTMLQWLSDGFSLPQLIETVKLIRLKPDKATGPIPANYLDRILRDPPKPQGRRHWRATDAGIEARGRELGLTPKPGEGYPAYADRIATEEASRRKSA